MTNVQELMEVFHKCATAATKLHDGRRADRKTHESVLPLFHCCADNT